MSTTQYGSWRFGKGLVLNSTFQRIKGIQHTLIRLSPNSSKSNSLRLSKFSIFEILLELKNNFFSFVSLSSPLISEMRLNAKSNILQQARYFMYILPQHVQTNLAGCSLLQIDQSIEIFDRRNLVIVQFQFGE